MSALCRREVSDAKRENEEQCRGQKQWKMREVQVESRLMKDDAAGG